MEAFSDTFLTDIPQRLDRLPWSRFHWLMATALGITWILDGLEVTVVGSLAGALTSRQALGLSASEVGLAASMYVFGAVIGAIVFGHFTDRLGRKPLFSVTVGLYLVATIFTGLSWNFFSFAVFRFLTGAGIGGEYSAINSAIQEFTPARMRGQVDLLVNGSFWVGAALGALGSVVVLDPQLFAPAVGWRLAFLVGGAIALVIVWLRRFVPESPRWLITHGLPDEAERIVLDIEARTGAARLAPVSAPRRYSRHFRLSVRRIASALFRSYGRRTALCLILMATQAFFYNAIFFTYALILTRFYGVAAGDVGWFILPFAAGNFLGPLLLGPLFDRVGRRPMIGATYLLAGLGVVALGYAFRWGMLDAFQQTLGWSVIFFFASAGASAAYLTIGESFPLEMRALTIALFYAAGTGLGGIAGPALFGVLIQTGTRSAILAGYVLGSALMVLAAIAEWVLGIAAERQSLEDLATPLSSAVKP